ncbi:MAG: hypothetical protein HYW22_01245 [Candidatus Aenigmarchaeota archaeon]|nr:hypothetical protein [Candidatus Aenigmarchaeota archaeon]
MTNDVQLRLEDFEAILYYVERRQARNFATALHRELGIPKEAGGYVSATKFDKHGESVGSPNTRQVRDFFREQCIDAKVIWADPPYDGISIDVRPPLGQDSVPKLRRVVGSYPFKRTSQLDINFTYVIPREMELTAYFGSTGVKRYSVTGEVTCRKGKLPDFVTQFADKRYPLSFGYESLKSLE